jgi:cytoskeletal protein RodZ
MILVVLILTAAGCAVAGVLSGSTLLGYVALVLSVLAALSFAIVLWCERRPASGAFDPDGAEPGEADEVGEPAEWVSSRPESDAVATADVAESAETGDTAETSAHSESTPSREQPLTPVNGTVPASVTTSVDRGADAIGAEGVGVVTLERRVSTGGPAAADEESQSVYVIPGRRRFHRVGCRILDAHAAEEVALDDASDEGFTACSLCITEPGAQPGHS